MLFLLLAIIGFFVRSSAANDQILTELKRISDTTSVNDGEGRLMRLRSCRNDVMIQCELCEEIRIINASYAASRARNGSDRCSDINFHQEFDCLLPVYSVYLKELNGNCSGTQSCKLSRRRAALDCGSLNETYSCCVETFYTCNKRTGVILSPLFIANDTTGNVRNVSLQCEASDLSVDSVVLAFNSSGDFPEGGICYRLSSNKEHVAKLCNRKGCSNVQVAGERSCGGNSHIQNYGAFIYYICGHSQQDQCQRTVATPTVPSTKASANSMVLLVSGVVVLVIAVVASFVVGFFVGQKRRRQMRRELQTGAADQKTSPCATRETREGNVSQLEMEGNTYQEISSIIVQNGILENSQYCEITDLEITFKQDRTEPERGRDNGESRKTDEKAYTEPLGKLESKQTTDDSDIGGIQSTAIYALATMVYDELDQSTEVPTSISAEVDFSKHNINPVYETVDESINDSIPDCNGAAQPGNVGESVYSNSDPSRRDSKPLYAKVNKSKPIATNT